MVHGKKALAGNHSAIGILSPSKSPPLVNRETLYSRFKTSAIGIPASAFKNLSPFTFQL
jgi:hypothetical protein